MGKDCDFNDALIDALAAFSELSRLNNALSELIGRIRPHSPSACSDVDEDCEDIEPCDELDSFLKEFSIVQGGA